MRQSAFERHPKLTLWVMLAVLAVGSIGLLEFIAGHIFGLGKTVIYEAHPLYGYRPYPNQTVARHPTQTIKINNLGFRAEQDWDTNPKNKVLFLGDSVTYGGSYIDNKALFSHLATKDLPGVIAGNAGVNGWGVDNVVAFIKDQHYLPADTYVLTFPEGDFYRGMTRIGGQSFWNTQPRYALEELFHHWIYTVHLKKFPALHAYQKSPAEKQKIAEVAVRHLKELSDYLHANGKSFYIYISPTQDQALGLEANDPILQALFKQYQLPVIYLKDKLPASTAAQTRAWFHDVIHLSNEGHAVWANVMTTDLINHKG